MERRDGNTETHITGFPYFSSSPTVHVSEKRFGTGTQARVRAFSTLKRVYALARRTGFLRNFHVFGSFVSSIPEPRDVDVVLIMAAHFRIEDCPSESQPLFWHLQAEARYGASVFWLKEGTASTQYFARLAAQAGRHARGLVEVA